MIRTIPGAALSALICVWMVTAASAANGEASPPADLILFHGKIITVDAADSVVQAVAIRGGKIRGGGLGSANPGAHRQKHPDRSICMAAPPPQASSTATPMSRRMALRKPTEWH